MKKVSLALCCVASASALIGIASADTAPAPLQALQCISSYRTIDMTTGQPGAATVVDTKAAVVNNNNASFDSNVAAAGKNVEFQAFLHDGHLDAMILNNTDEVGAMASATASKDPVTSMLLVKGETAQQEVQFFVTCTLKTQGTN